MGQLSMAASAHDTIATRLAYKSELLHVPVADTAMHFAQSSACEYLKVIMRFYPVLS